MGRRHRRQLLLFLAVLILPIVTIAVQGRRLVVQEDALARTRVEEIRTRTAAEIGQEIVARLERIKTLEMANVPAAARLGDGYSDPAVVAVGWTDGVHLVWPWESLPQHLDDESPRYAQAIEAGRRAEFEARDHALAAERYQQAVERARDDAERARARLAVARTRLRTGEDTRALAAYRDVLDLPSAVTDEHGVSYWSSAALPLVALGAGAEVLARVIADRPSTDRPLPVQLYRVRSILEALRQSGDEAVEEAGAGCARRAGVAAGRCGASGAPAGRVPQTAHVVHGVAALRAQRPLVDRPVAGGRHRQAAHPGRAMGDDSRGGRVGSPVARPRPPLRDGRG
jgi:hypothetical protein